MWTQALGRQKEGQTCLPLTMLPLSPGEGFCFPEWFGMKLPILVLLSAHEEGGLPVGVETFSCPAVLSLSG